MGMNGKEVTGSIESDSYEVSSNNQSDQSRLALGDHDNPTFDIEQVQLQFGLNHKLHSVAVQNNKMFLIVDGLIYKIDLKNPSQVKRFQIPGTTPSKATAYWLHPNGLHLFIEVNNNSYYYLHDSYSSFKILPRFKNLNIKYFAFPDSPSSSDTTNDFLFGTSDGSIYIALVKSHDPISQENKRDDKYTKFVYKPTSPSQLMGLAFAENCTQINAVTEDKIYSWDCFDTSYAELIKVFKSSTPNITNLSNFRDAAFVTNNEQYVHISRATNEIYTNDSEIQLSQAKKLNTGGESLSMRSGSFILTPHHLITLNKTHQSLLIFNKLTLSSNPPVTLSFKQHVNKNEEVLDITFDFKAQTYWIYTNNSIYELIIQNEAISVWYNYYKMGKYDEALKCFKSSDHGDTTDPDFFKRDAVLVKQGYHYLQQGGFGIDSSLNQDTIVSDDGAVSYPSPEELLKLQVRGIKILAKSTEPFEKVCLMLLNIQSNSSKVPSNEIPINSSESSFLLKIISEKLLVEYLLSKYDHSKNVENNRIRIIILSSWIVELMLRLIYRLEYETANGLIVSSLSTDKELNGGADLRGFKSGLLNDLNDQFKLFLQKNYKLLDSKTIYQIIKELHFPSKLLYYADLIEDYEFILKYYIDNSNWKEALKTIIKIYSCSKKELREIIYENAITLLMNSPKSTVETWLKLGNDIKYENFLPAILTYNKTKRNIPINENYSIQFLSKLIYSKGVLNKQINNYYLSLLITYPDNNNLAVKQVIKFLNHIKLEEPTSSKKSSAYDHQFILRLCLAYEQYQPAVLILLNDMSLFDQALKLALSNDLTDLGEFVLRKYDEFIENNGQLKVSGFNSNSDDQFNFKATENKFYNEGDREQDISVVGKINLEEENYSSRKQLWIMYAKYLIDRVNQGKTFDFLQDVKSEKVDANGDTADEPEQEKGSDIKSITNDIAKSVMNGTGVEKSDSVDDKEKGMSENFNKVLKYILSLSNSSNNIGIIGLKDLLPLFPESIMINNFKDEIVKSLNQYNNKINQLSLEMKESLAISSNLKSKIKESYKVTDKAKIYSIIQPGEPCHLCNTLLISKNYVYFPNCHHGFHKDCLIRSYLKPKGNYKFKKVFQNFKRDPSSQNKKELDNFLTKECIFCNLSSIGSIDNSIIDPEADSAELAEWEL